MTLLLMLVIIISCLYNYTNSYKNPIGLDRVIYSKVLMSTNQEVLSSSSSSSVDDDNFKAPINEIDRRRNFAIISHPDAGKTTLTEKLLLFGGAIQDAGAVKARADQRKATSDWMEIEKQRGISVTSTVLSFEYSLQTSKFHLNLLDTPGHQDFSEDTYRTLAAADNCVMLIDAAKGIEDRTRKLFEVCRMRKLPIFTFTNKMDRPSLTPFEIIDQLEKEFALECCPMNWPIGDGESFQGVLDRATNQVHLFQRGDRRKKIAANVVDLNDPDLKEIIGESLHTKLLEDIEVLDMLIPEPNEEKIINGDQTPLFFGSAMTNFGVELFLQTFLKFAQRPAGREAVVSSESNDISQVLVTPESDEFTGFVFKLQANLDPRHRDRMAFIRVCSGTFKKGMKVSHSRMKKSINLSSAQSLFAQDRESITEAFPGDVIGIHNPGHFAIGDTIYTGGKRVAFPGIPSFSPEKFAYIRNPNPSTYKKFQKGLSELLDEGAVQMLRDRGDDGNGTPLLAAVGQLQFEVVEYRLKNEYTVDSIFEKLDYSIARWVNGGWDAIAKAEADGKLFGVYIVKDRWERPVLLFRNEWKERALVTEAEYLDLVPWSFPPVEF
jgi:peptide chain release factor 3